MTIIPYNNETTGFSLEAFKRSQEEYAERQRALEELKKKERIYNKEVKPFKDELKKLKKEELEKLKTNSKFLKRCEKDRKEGILGKDYYEHYSTGGCGYESIDLVYHYGSDEYKKRVSELEYEISKRNYLLY